MQSRLFKLVIVVVFVLSLEHAQENTVIVFQQSDQGWGLDRQSAQH